MRALTIALLLALGAAAASAYRSLPPQWLSEEMDFGALSAGFGTPMDEAPAGAAGGLDALRRRGSKDHISTGVKYFVDPNHHSKFIEAWRDLEGAAAEEKGIVIFDLKKTVDDDITFVGFGEWRSAHDWMGHAESEHTAKFVSFLADQNIPFRAEPLYAPQDAGELKRTDQEGGKRKHRMAHALVRYIAPPSAHRELVGAWHEAMQETSKEKGARIYSLRKAVNDNTQFVGYGTWDSVEDLHRHFESDHVSKLKDKLADIHAYWRITLLWKVGDQPE
ncbi:MAG: hypothetical protein J3K34DRAFT_431557 [Monoraphidium minutum]|nr:MAG: hypothetical protein J3K34DRAFT_431557 [Monoraphidium minutum]